MRQPDSSFRATRNTRSAIILKETVGTIFCLASDWLITANYAGNSTIHLVTSNQFNSAVFLGLGSCAINGVSYATCSTTTNQNQRRVLYLQNPAQGQYYASIVALDDGGTADYNG